MNNVELGTLLLIAIISMVICMLIIPVAMKYASTLGMVDHPDPRKVHAQPIPRVGGLGLVIGSLVPMIIWLPYNSLTISIILGGLVLLVFGIWDDVKELGHYAKFIGQIIAVILVVYYGNIYVLHFPYIGLTTIPESIGKPFTVFAIVGVINALNHSDGLDGLAGGESLLSLGAISYLAYLYNGATVMIIASSLIGGIFGFLRFNSHPARVFMGDGGSQFIGYAVGVLAVLLTQKVNPVMSPALPLLLVGLPIVDILAVFFLRAKKRMNLFRATRNHIHHRLLDLGFYHYESVMLIYSLQAFFVICAIFIPYANDYLITAIYLVVSGLVFALLTYFGRKHFCLHRTDSIHSEIGVSSSPLISKYVRTLPAQVLETGVILFLFGAALTSTTIPYDIAISALILFAVLVFLVAMPQFANIFLIRLIAFVSIGFAVYLSTNYPTEWLLKQHYLVYLFFIILSVAGFFVLRTASGQTFQITPLDYLLVIALLIVALLPEDTSAGTKLTFMTLQMVVLFYACELLLQRMDTVRSRLSGTLIVTLLLISMRGLL